jgi:hypothetical protein
MNCKKLLFGITVAIPILIAGCGGNPELGIELSTPPPANLEVNLSTSVAATVTHDPFNAGVDWSCTPVGSCGTFTPAHTASGAATVFTAPRTAGPIMIVAASTRKPTKQAPASVNITAVVNATSVTGTYTYFANGTDSGLAPYGVAGSVVINGATGMVTGGEQDYFDVTSGNIFPSDPITGGSISVGSDGRGTLTIMPTSAPAETFSITVVNDKHILITDFDGTQTASGSLDLQTAPTTTPTGKNAFALLDSFEANALGGVLTSNGTITTASEADDDIGGAPDFDLVNTVTGSFTAPDANGRGTVTLTDPNFGLAGFSSSFTLAYYVVGPEAFRLIEIDGETTLLPQFAVGSMYGQGAAAFSAASLGSKFVFGQSGVANGMASGLGIYATAGQFTGNGTTALSAGVADVNLGDGAPKLAAALTGSTYFVHADGYAGIAFPPANTDNLANMGVYLVDPAINVADPNNSSGGGGAVMLDLDVNTLGSGFLVPQASGAKFAGNYAFSQDGFFETSSSSADYGLVGQVASDGTSNIAGLADENELNLALNPGVTVSGTFTADGANPGRLTTMITINGAATPNNITAYQASNGLLVHVDVDSTSATVGNVGLGVLEQQP